MATAADFDTHAEGKKPGERIRCVVVTPEFYDAVVAPSLGRQHGVVYVLPESQPVRAYFGADPAVATGR